MNAANPALPLPAAVGDHPRLLAGVAVGLLAASIGALYTVFARWGIARGLQSPDLTVLRFGLAGVLTLPVLGLAWRRDSAQFIDHWRAWALVALLAWPVLGHVPLATESAGLALAMAGLILAVTAPARR